MRHFLPIPCSAARQPSVWRHHRAQASQAAKKEAASPSYDLLSKMHELHQEWQEIWLATPCPSAVSPEYSAERLDDIFQGIQLPVRPPLGATAPSCGCPLFQPDHGCP